jgi:hypothetical protein
VHNKFIFFLPANLKKFSNINTFYIALLYLIAHGGIFFISNSIYWDDWTLYNTDSKFIVDNFRQAGTIFAWPAYLHIFLLKINPWLYRALTFLLMGFSGFFLYIILKRFSGVSKNTRFLIVLFFLILPFNFGRVALINFPYILCYFLFFLAWASINRLRLLSLIVFFFSFSMNSLLVFYAVPVFEKLYREKFYVNIKMLRNCIKNNLDYILLPLVFFYIKIHFFKPYGNYVGYNEDFSIQNVKKGLHDQYWSTKDYILNSLLDLNQNYLVLLAFLFVVFYITSSKIFISKRNLSFNFSSLGVLIGIIVFLFGVFPYWVVGLTPAFLDWGSRHQILMPLGVSIILASFLSYNKMHPILFRGFFSIMTALCLLFNIIAYSDFFIDWKKQNELVNFFIKNEQIKNSDLLLFSDTTRNALTRRYRFYEWNGLLKLAYNNEKHFGINEEELPAFLSGIYDNTFNSHYNANEFQKSNIISASLVKISSINSDSIFSLPVYIISVQPIDL